MNQIKFGEQTILLDPANNSNLPAGQSLFSGTSTDGTISADYVTGPTMLKKGAKRTMFNCHRSDDIDTTAGVKREETNVNITVTGVDMPDGHARQLETLKGFVASLSVEDFLEASRRIKRNAANATTINSTLLTGVLTAISDTTP